MRVFNLANLANFESFAKCIQLKFEPLHCHVHVQHSMNSFKTAIRENLDPQNISAIIMVVYISLSLSEDVVDLGLVKTGLASLLQKNTTAAMDGIFSQVSSLSLSSFV